MIRMASPGNCWDLGQVAGFLLLVIGQVLYGAMIKASPDKTRLLSRNLNEVTIVKKPVLHVYVYTWYIPL